jgi:hypothetical protein
VVGLHIARTLLTLFRSSNLPPAVARSEANPEVAALTARTVEALGITGPFLVQYKVDRRDGVARILEANCKLSYRIWTAMADGLDVPRLALEVAKHGTAEPVGPTRTGSVFVNGPEWFLARRLSRDRARPVAEVVRHGPTVLDPYSQEFFRRPRVAAVWWSTFLGFAVKEQLKRRLGRLMHPVLGPHA